MGANTFNIRNKSSSIRIGKKGTKPKRYASISYAEAIRFKNEFYTTTSVSSWASSTATISLNQKSEPNLNITGTDENYLLTAGYKLADGRNFTIDEVKQGKHVIIIGEEVKKNIFENLRQ